MKAERQGETVKVDWAITEEHPKPESLKLEYAESANGPWTTVAVKPGPTGRAEFQTAAAVTVRMQVQDMAENQGLAIKQVPAVNGASASAASPFPPPPPPLLDGSAGPLPPPRRRPIRRPRRRRRIARGMRPTGSPGRATPPPGPADVAPAPTASADPARPRDAGRPAADGRQGQRQSGRGLLAAAGSGADAADPPARPTARTHRRRRMG